MVDKALRILHSESSCGWGGQEIRILNEITGFLQRGHQVELVCPPQAEIFKAAQDRGIIVHALPIVKKRFSALFAMRLWLKKNVSRFDVINSHSSTDSWLVALGMLSLQKKVPVVRTRHVSTTVNQSFLTRWLYIRASQHIVTTGEALRHDLHETNGFSLSHMTSVPTGVDVERFTFDAKQRSVIRNQLGLLEDALLIGIVSTLRTWKGHDYLFQCLHELQKKHESIHLVVVGDGPNGERLQASVIELGVEHLVTFVGRQSNVEAWLSAFDVFCLPSYGEEGVPQAIMQALACECPVVSTSVGAIQEAVIPNETGLIVEARNSDALGDALDRLLVNPDLRQQLGQQGRQHVVANLALPKMLDDMDVIFRHAIASYRHL